MTRVFICAFLILLASRFSRAAGDVVEGVSSSEILLGSSIPVTGQNSNTAREFSDGSAAAFARVNSTGGISGRTIKVIVADDQFNPAKTKDNTLKFARVDKVLALWDYYGSNQVKIADSIAEENDLPLLFPHSGGALGRTQVEKNLFHLRSGQHDQGTFLASYAVRQLQSKKLGIFYEDSDYGTGGLTGIQSGLQSRGFTAIRSARYSRFGDGIDAAVADIAKFAPDAVILVAEPTSAEAFVRKAAELKFFPRILGFSASFSPAVLTAMGSRVDQAYFFNCFPLLRDSDDKLVREFREDMEKIKSRRTTPIAFESYIAARILVQALTAAGHDLNRASLRRALEHTDTKLGNLEIKLSPTKHQAIDYQQVARGSSDGLKSP